MDNAMGNNLPLKIALAKKMLFVKKLPIISDK